MKLCTYKKANVVGMVEILSTLRSANLKINTITYEFKFYRVTQHKYQDI